MANSTLAAPRSRWLLGWPARWRGWPIAPAGEPLLLLGLMLVGLVALGLNTFNYPAFTWKEDEGVYLSQAWAVLREGQLAPYTYVYDHAPAGWLLLAAWMALSGGPATFGAASDSGRILMLLLHVAMVPLVYHLARKLGCRPLLAALAGLLFSISPLAIVYQRLVLLDSMMLFWALLSLDLLLDGWGRLSRVILSGCCFGLALLTKETAIVLLPVFWLIMVHQRRGHQGRFALGGWLLPLLIVVSWYPVYALLKGELLPTGRAAWSIGTDPNAHVSLLDAVLWQVGRTAGGGAGGDSRFWSVAQTAWLPQDALLCVGGVAAVALNLVRGIRDRRALVAGLLGLLPLAYLARGGLVFDFYILFAIPFLCINLAVLLAPLFSRLPTWAAGGLAAALAVALAGGYWQVGQARTLYSGQPDDAGRAAITWIKQHLPPESLIIARTSLWTDLREPGLGGPAFPGVHSHWKVAQDPAVRLGVFRNDWRAVDYLVVDPTLVDDFRESENVVALEALRNAHLVRRWVAEVRGDPLHAPQVLELWKVDKAGRTEAAFLAGSNAYLAGRFERAGAFPDAAGVVTSEAQAYALLRAVWSNDRAAFDRTWAWTRAHLEDADGLLAWRWEDGAVTDAHSASDADTDAALALLLAGRRWEDAALLEAGTRLVRAIWEHQVATVDGVPYLTAGDWATRETVLALNPSYFAPYAYHVFAAVDPEHDWNAVVESSYQILFAASAAPLGATQSAGLPPDWVGLDRVTGELLPLWVDERDTTRYSYDAARTYWRVALDGRWWGDGRADAYLRLADFLQDEVARNGTVSAVYAHDGAIVEQAPSLVAQAGALAALLTRDPSLAHALYAAQIVGDVSRDAGRVYWGNPNDLYGQEWGWFLVALYADALPNLWTAP